MQNINEVEVDGVYYRKSSYSPRGDRFCVGIKFNEGTVSVINTKTKGPVVEFTSGEWAAFIKGVKDGEFDIKI